MREPERDRETLRGRAGTPGRGAVDCPFVLDWLRRVGTAMDRHQDHLIQLDSAIGDGDHGANMARGFAAVRAALDALPHPPASPGAALTAAGETLISVVGGASGPLYGGAFRTLGAALGTAPEVGARRFAAGLVAALATMQRLGAAVPGDKTMIDTCSPAVHAFRGAAESGADLPAAARAAALAAEDGMRATIPLQARKGRASYLGLRSVGHQDPGATSSCYLFRALAEAAAAPATSMR
ncbi:MULTISPECIES: dihydroxyacetone kinase subunit DhaL [unclassified Streptomyces]|uniref:dihydroxyacetone kinase subunit DhaL n=1 Tax=unclassified Streptomyces TaxID=2593676 RepID=UPI0003A104D4|nr:MULTISPECIES: dihydroxyacetone kinase subunit DhaL [unclassified Streptomyces]MYT29125.1 dihydroxyacetone kinase subunit L [Streptomyces sp. SID8354]